MPTFEMPFIVSNFFANSFLLGLYNVIRILFIIADALLVFGFIFSVSKGIKFRPKFHVSRKKYKQVLTLQSAIFRKRWKEITSKFAEGRPDSMRLAIIEADSLVDQLLKKIGLQGEHMADRLSKLNADEVKSLNRLWRAHKLRNDLVHTPGFFLGEGDAKAGLADFEAFFKEIGVL